MKKFVPYIVIVALIVSLLPVVAAPKSNVFAGIQKSLYVNANLNAGSPIRAYGILPAPTYLQYQDTSNTTGYGGVGLALDADSSTLFVSYETYDYIKIVDAQTLEVPPTGVHLPNANNVAGLAYDHEKQLLYAVNRATGHLYVYAWDAVAKTLSNTVTTYPYYLTPAHLSSAYGLSLDETNDLLYVGDYNYGVRVYHTSDWSLADEFALYQRPMDVAVDSVRGVLYSGNALSIGRLYKTDLATKTHTYFNVRGYTGVYNDCVVGVAVDESTGYVYITTGNMVSGGSDRIIVFDSDLAPLYQTGDIGSPTGLVVPNTGTTYDPLNLDITDDVADGECVSPGNEITYTISYENVNPYEVSNVMLEDTLPEEVTFVSASDGGTFSGDAVSWDMGTLASGASDIVTLTVSVNPEVAAGTTITNRVSIDCDQLGIAFATEDTEVCNNQPPAAICHDITVDLDARGQVHIEAADVDGGSYDPDGDTLTLSIDKDTFTCADEGVNTVILTVTDSHGLSDSCEAIVIVNDVTAPVPDIAELPVITAECSVTVTQPTATDICGGTVKGKTTDRVVYNRQGTYTILWEYDDGHDNVSYQLQTVIIKDITPPVLTCPANVIVDQQSAEGTIVPLNATATDNCACDVFIASTALPIYPVGTTEVTFIATDNAGNISYGSTFVTVLPSKDMKENILNELISLDPDEFDKPILYIENSLNPDYWNDDTHLDSQHGHKVFNEERHAVTELMKYYQCNGLESLTLKYKQGAGFALDLGNADDILTDNGNGTYTISPAVGMDKLSPNLTICLDTQVLADIHTSGSAPIEIGYVYGDFIVTDVDRMLHIEDVSQEVRDMAYGAIERLVRIDRTLAETNIIEAANEPVLDPANQDQVDHELDLAHLEFATGDERRDSGDFDHAIDHYRNAWNHACHAIEHAVRDGEFECIGIISLTLSYAGGAGFEFSFDRNGDDTQSIVDNGDGTYTILPQAGEDVLPNDTTLYLDRQEVVSIHTESTSNIAVGDVYGDFTIVAFEAEATFVKPTIVSIPVTTAVQEQLYTYEVQAMDPDEGDVLTFSLDTAPDGMTIDPVSGIISWTPAITQTGNAPVTVRVIDTLGLFDIQSFVIRVGDLSGPPEIISTPPTGATQGQPYSYDVEAIDPEEGDILTYSLDIAPVGMTIDPVTGLINWTPTSIQVGSNAVIIRVTDAGGAPDIQGYTINVLGVNGPPQITSIPVTVATQDMAYSYSIQVTDPDMGDIQTYSLDASPEGMTINSFTGLIQWTPDNTQVGNISVTAKVVDTGGLSNTQTWTIEVADVSDPPQIESTANTAATQDAAYTYDVEAVDPDIGDVLIYSLDTSPNGMNIDSMTGLIEWIPLNTQVGANSVVVRVTDTTGLSDTQIFTIDVANVNDAPEIISTPVTAATQDVGYTYDLEAIDPDPADTLTWSLDVAPAGMSIDSSTGLIDWTPIVTQIGDNPVAVSVVDGTTLSDTQSFTITVVDNNQPPLINSTPDTTATEGVLYTYVVDGNDPNAGDVLTYYLDTAPSGMIIDSMSGLIQWTPAQVHVGSNAVKVRVTDQIGLSAFQQFSIDVADASDPPVITSLPVIAATEGIPYTYDVDATDPDIGDVLTYSLDTYPDGMTIDPSTGLIEWTPSNTQVGQNTVTVRVTDTAGLPDTQSFTIAVANVNNAPEIISEPGTAATQDNLYTYDVDATDPDIGDVLTYSLDTSPNGMAIDSSTGLIEWSPSNAQVGENSVVVRVTDTAGFPDTQSFTINVANVNDAPEIISEPGTGATQDCLYTYDVDATDPDIGGVLTYSLDIYPDGMTIDSSTGLIEWTPSNAHVGLNTVTVSVQDSGSLNDTQEFVINVAAVNETPVISSTPMLGVTQGIQYVYDVEATDSDGDTLTYTLTVKPSGMTINSASGLINWTPTSAQLGDNDVVVRVDDGRGGIALQPFSVKVSEPGPDYIRPVVGLTISPNVVLPGTPVTITVNASDNTGVVSRSLTVNGGTVPLDSSGTVNYSSPVPGEYTVEATALDAAGNEGYASGYFSVIVLDGDTTYPTAEIESPEDDATLSVPTEITGTADDDNLVYWALQYSIMDMDDYTIIAEGNSSVTSGVLGTFDTTILENGFYDVKLMARDARGHIKSVKKAYRVEGDMKAGNFTISYNDLTIPMSGIDITVTRTYDSLDKTKGDFGIGWTLGIADIQIRESGVMGEDWIQMSASSGGPIPITAYSIGETKSHIVTVSYPDGRVDEFRMVVDPDFSYMLPVQWTNVSFQAEEGTLSTLEALTNNYVYVDGMSPATLLDMDTFTIYNPDRYRLTTQDGTVYIINQATGVESIQDTNGNTVTIGSDGIIHSAGTSVTFNRDAEGRITSITDPAGKTIEYEYDAYGDLVSVTDQEGSQTTFTYNHRHGLLDILDPRGIMPVRNEYDDDGKLIAHIDADGNRIEYTHDTDTRQEIITDRLGNITVMEYDDDGNIVQITDAMGNHTYATYDGRGNKLSETNALGYTTTYTYDESDNLLTETDPLDNVTTFTYNDRGQMLTRADPNGNVTTGEYDAAGNMTKVIDPLDNETVFAYDAAGNQISTEDPLHNVTHYAYDSKGNLVSKTDREGNVTTYTYDANGNRLSRTATYTTPSGPETIITSYVYDGLNRLVQTTDPYGYTTITEYDAVGQVTAVTDKLGNRTERVYDNRGNLERIIYPDGTEQSYTYDVENRQLTATDRAGRTTEFEYDNLGRQILITYPDGTWKETTYDAIGQVVQVTGCSSCGINAAYTYDAAGRNTEVTDAMGYTTFYDYDANGNMTGMTDARGNTTGYVYDENDQQTETIFADLTSASTEYDALGQIISETDQAGKVTRYEYDALGQLTKVTDALGNETVYAYDEAGNRISQTDANDHTTSFEYDKLGRMVKQTLPLGMSETTVYDAEGNVTSQTDFNGDTITFEYDENNRLITKSFPNGTSESYTYTDAGMRESVTDSLGVTSYEYDQRYRLIRQINPDGEELSYTYDEAGNRTSVTVPSGTTHYTFDCNERLLTVTDPDDGITTYTYDAVGNRASITYPNGTVAEYTYDSLNRLTDLVNRKSTGEITSSYAYTPGAAGNRTQVTEDSGRVVDYTYDSIYRLTGETIDDPVSGLKTISYTYDSVGNRLTKTDDGVTTSYTYDDNDRLLTEDDTNYSWDDNGNLLGKVNTEESISYTYDFQNRLVEANTTDTSGSSVVEYAYDTDGIRVQKIIDATDVTNYLVDKNRPYAQVLEERDGSGVLTVSYIYGDDLISQDRSGVDSYYHYDGQMSTRALTDAAEAVTDTYTYDAFGNLLDQTGAIINNYLYTGEQYDPNINFYYLRARYYDTGTGRFTTRDPWQGSAFDPPSLHKYLYAGADPVNNWDPSGQQTTTYDTLITLGMVSALSCIAMTYISIPEVNLPMQNVELHFDLYQYLNSAVNWWDNLWSQDRQDPYEANPEQWEKVGKPRPEPATGGKYIGGTSVEQDWTNTETGEKMTEHTIYDKNGKIKHHHRRYSQ